MPDLKVQVYMEFKTAKEAKPGWVTWYQYFDPANLSIARQQRESLGAKGYDVRVTIDGTVDGVEPVCTFCEASHPEPYDGSCLL